MPEVMAEVDCVELVVVGVEGSSVTPGGGEDVGDGVESFVMHSASVRLSARKQVTKIA